MGLIDRVGYQTSLVFLVDGTQQGDTVALCVVGPNLFVYLFHVLGDDRVGGIDYHLGGAVVLFKLEEVEVGIVAAEVEDILDIRATEGIDTLRIVAHHADVLQPGGEFLHNEVLRIVGVLILVDHDVLETLLVLKQHIGEVAEEDVHVEEQVVEVHGHGIAEAVVIKLVDLGNHGLVGILVSLLDFGVVGVVFGREEVALGHGDATHDIAGAVGLGVEIQILDNLLDG